MSIISELLTNMGHATEQGFFGVTAIYVYMALIVGTAFYRIHQFRKEARPEPTGNKAGR